MHAKIVCALFFSLFSYAALPPTQTVASLKHLTEAAILQQFKNKPEDMWGLAAQLPILSSDDLNALKAVRYLSTLEQEKIPDFLREAHTPAACHLYDLMIKDSAFNVTAACWQKKTKKLYRYNESVQKAINCCVHEAYNKATAETIPSVDDLITSIPLIFKKIFERRFRQMYGWQDENNSACMRGSVDNDALMLTKESLLITSCKKLEPFSLKQSWFSGDLQRNIPQLSVCPLTLHMHKHYLCAGGPQGEIRIINSHDQTSNAINLLHSVAIQALAALNSTTLIAGCSDGTVREIVCQEGNSPRFGTLYQHAASVKALAYLQQWCASVDDDGCMNIWDMHARSMYAHGETDFKPSYIAFLNNDTILAADERTIKLFSVAHCLLRTAYDIKVALHDAIAHIALIDGILLYSLPDGVIRLCDPYTGMIFNQIKASEKKLKFDMRTYKMAHYKNAIDIVLKTAARMHDCLFKKALDNAEIDDLPLLAQSSLFKKVQRELQDELVKKREKGKK